MSAAKDEIKALIKVIDGWMYIPYLTEYIQNTDLPKYKKVFNVDKDIFLLYNIKEKKYFKSINNSNTVSFTSDILKAKQYSNYIEAQFEYVKMSKMAEFGVATAYVKKLCNGDLKTCKCLVKFL